MVDGGKRTQEGKNAITMPRNMQTATEKAGEDLETAESAQEGEAEEEDQAMALWLSDPEDDESMDEEDWAVTNGAGIQIGNALVEGKREDSRRVDEAGNQPIPQPPEPEEKLPLAQPEEQGENGGKAASGGSGDGVDEANKAIWASATRTEGRHKVCPKMAERREVYSEAKGRHKVYPSAEDDAKSVRHPYNDRTQFNFDDADLVSTPMYPNETLSKGQHPSTTANMAKMNDVPFREGNGTLPHTPKLDSMFPIAIDAIFLEILEEPLLVSSDQSSRGGGGGVPWINPRELTMAEYLEEPGGTYADTVEHDLQSLEGEGDISVVSGEEKGHLPVFGDPRGVPQHSRGGYQPRVSTKPVRGTPRKGANAISTKEEEDVARC
jgi:hypothetical protein